MPFDQPTRNRLARFVAERPVIRRSHIVCAEPMPGDRALLEEFLAELREERLESLIRGVIAVPENQRVRATPSMADALAGLVRTVWAEMELAGEAGSLLKIEESLADAIERGRAEWDEKLPLFRVETFRMTDGGEAAPPKVSYPRTMPDGGADFWARAEGLVLAALEAYAQRAENGRSYARRLFAGDAARGFAFIDLCRQRYDVVLMNPPFGNPSHGGRAYLRVIYPNLWADIYAAFIERSISYLVPKGRMGAITSRSLLALSSFEYLRSLLLGMAQIQLVVECGLGVLDDATVRAAFYVAALDASENGIVPFWDLRNSQDRANDLLSSLGSQNTSIRYFAKPKKFAEIPGQPFAYWLPNELLQILIDGPHLNPKRLQNGLGSGYAHVAVGASTTDDTRFVRCHWEVQAESIGKSQWARFAHAVGFARYYSPTYAILNWFNRGKELLSLIDERGNVKPRLRCEEFFFEPGLVSPYISERGLGCSYLSRDHIVSNSCRAYFNINLDTSALLAFLNSELTDLLLWSLTPDRKHEAGIIAALPLLPNLEVAASELSKLAHECWRSVVILRSIDETDPLHQIVFKKFVEEIREADSRYLESQAKIDRLVNSLTSAAHTISNAVVASEAPHDLGGWASDDSDSNYISAETSASQDDERVRQIASHSLGACFGRWDIRISSGQTARYQSTDPFAPLPVCPPGMLQNTAGLPASPADVPADYPLRISWPGILVDDPGHPEDIENRVREALRVIWPENADAIEQEACQILGVDGLRAWFANPNSFFDDHLKRYSKSRRYAPIYWPLSTASGSYTLWLYYHRLTDQSLYGCVNDFVEPKLKVIGEQLSVIRGKGGRSSGEERELERLADLERELIDFREELLRIARFWRPNLNDGVQITAAPLWRLFRHRGWSKRLQETWEKLEAGEYDWAHLARSVWPQRVVPKCVEDRSLAIAHDVEALFWVEDGGNWRNLHSPADELAEQRRRLSLSKPRSRAAALLGDLARRRGQSYSAAQLYAHLAGGDWDDLPLARLLWPERIAEKCWNDPLLAMDWRVTLPGKSTKKAHREFFAHMEAEGCPEVAPALAAALAEEQTPFPQLWARLAGGQQDDGALALALWPERVLEKCLEDAALAGVHGLRGFFWVEGPGGVWRRRVAPADEVAGEVGRQT